MKPKPFVLTGLVVLLISSGSFALAIPTLNILSQEYTAHAIAFGYENSSGPDVTNTASVGPVTAISSTPNPVFPIRDAATASATANGFVESYGGFLSTGGGVFAFNGAGGLAEATSVIDFLVTEDLVFYMHTSGFFSFGGGAISLFNVTDDVPVVTRSIGQNTFEHFDSPLLEVSKHYRLRAEAVTFSLAPDAGHVSVGFNVPEPPSFWLLFPALGLLGVGQGLRRRRAWLEDRG